MLYKHRFEKKGIKIGASNNSKQIGSRKKKVCDIRLEGMRCFRMQTSVSESKHGTESMYIMLDV